MASGFHGTTGYAPLCILAWGRLASFQTHLHSKSLPFCVIDRMSTFFVLDYPFPFLKGDIFTIPALLWGCIPCILVCPQICTYFGPALGDFLIGCQSRRQQAWSLVACAGCQLQVSRHPLWPTSKPPVQPHFPVVQLLPVQWRHAAHDAQKSLFINRFSQQVNSLAPIMADLSSE